MPVKRRRPVGGDEAALDKVLQVRQHGEARGGAKPRLKTLIDMGDDRLDRRVAGRKAR